jgi:hypothetical protein
MAEELQKENNANKHLTNEEIREIIGLARKPGMRFTVDLYLLDYIKHCFLEGGQLNENIQKLQNALGHLEGTQAKQGVQEVISSLQCVQTEYNEYVEDMKILADGGYPGPRGAGQVAEDAGTEVTA